MLHKTFDNIYLTLGSVATSIGIGYEIASHDLFKATMYWLMTFMFAGERILRELECNKLENRVKKY
jgi:hypothetical protein